MCVAQTSKRRRTQARNHYRHISALRRPKYSKHDAETSEKRLKRLIEREKVLRSRKGSKK